jgi:hypothetical protein
MSNNEIDKFDQQFENISHKAVKGFQDDILDLLVTDSNFFDNSPTELLLIEDGTELFEYIINDDYWVRHWSIYLIRQIMSLVYE